MRPAALGNAHPNLVPYETFRTADGELAVAVGSERQWPRLCEALGLPGLAADPRFATNGDRVDHRAALRPMLAARFATQPTADWPAVLDAADIPCGPINDVRAAFATPQARAREMIVDVEHPVLGTVRQVGLPFRLSATPGVDPHARRRCSASTPRRSSRSSATGRPRSTSSARLGAST